MAWDKEENYAKKKDLEDYTKKNTFNKKVEEIEATLSTKITKEELNSKAEVSEMEKRLCISDFEKHKSELDNKLKTYANKEEIPNISHLAEKELLKKYLLKQDLSEYVKKSELQPVEISYCMVKLKSDFRIYDGTDWAFEFYMGNRGDWQIINDTHKTLKKPEEYSYITPFKGLFSIDFCFTCRKDTHLLKPRALQRIRSSAGEFINWQYHETTAAVGHGHDVTVLTFRDRVELLLEKGAWIKCSMEFDNRLHQYKKQWLHAVGSAGSYTPTYFSISGIKS